MENETKQDELDIGGLTGDEILTGNQGYQRRVLYMSDEQHDAMTLFDAATHVLDAFTTVPRGLVVAETPQCGKSTALGTICTLGWNAWMVDPTGPALRAKFNEREKPLVVIDEISEYYGKSGLRQGPKDLNKILLEGYAKNAKLSLSEDRSTVDVSSFCFAAMGGLKNAVRPDIWSRSVVWTMRPVPSSVHLEDALDDDVLAAGKIEQQRLHQWARENEAAIKDAFRNFRRPHRKMVARLRQVWGPLYAVALVAGEDWPQRCVAAFKVMALDASERPVLSVSQMILRDAAKLFASNGMDKAFARDIAAYLRSLPDIELYQDLSDMGLARAMTEALGPAQSMDIGTQRAKGFHARPIVAAWARLEAKLDPQDDEPEENEFEDFFDVEDIEITEVTNAVFEQKEENTSPPAETAPSRKSRIIDEPEMSLTDPPCNADSDSVVPTPRRRNGRRTLPAVERRFLKEEALK